MPAIERFAAAFTASIEELKARVAIESLTSVPDERKNSFGFGEATGRLKGIQLVSELVEKLLYQDEETPGDESKPSRRTRA